MNAYKEQPQNINGKEHRPFFAIPGMLVSEDGKSIYRRNKSDVGSILPSRPPYKLTINEDKNGNAIIKTKDHGVKRVDDLVIRCFKGNPGCVARVFHKDGNKSNCHKDNLEWISMRKYNDLFYKNEDWKELFGEKDDIQINVKTGEVKQFGKTVPQQDLIYDSDMDQIVKVNEFVEIMIETRYGPKKMKYGVSELIQSVI